MIALDVLFIGAALVVGVAIGGHCAAFSARDLIRSSVRARDRAITATEDATARADAAEQEARVWQHRARTLGRLLEERCGPAIVEPSETVVLFRGAR